ncbi:MAG TPA: exopolysaccharide biosynthesis polyprenyl glycosylphosphotransferase [bacterium]|nr:exopolysaccharide biosynthesis polyprenyl glycosylphosphotransferase [bacterium]
MTEVTVVIPAYNAEATLEKCLAALSDQTLDREYYEIIVVNDGSTDDTAKIARNYDVRVLDQSNQGPAMARNTGAADARGEIIVFTDADCVADRQFLEEMIRPFSDPSIVGVKGVYRTQQTRLWARFAQIEFMERYAKLERSESIDFVDSYAAAFRKRVFNQVGGFDPHFPVANNEDVDLSYKIAGMGYPMVFNPRAIVYHTHPDSMTRYLKLKFSRAYWRMLVYRRFPEKIVSDSYTPQSLKVQILLTGLMLGFAALAPFVPGTGITALVLFGLFLAATAPFLFRTARNDPRLVLFAPAGVFLRSLAFGLGIASGILAQRRRSLLFPILLLTSDVLAATGAYLGAYWVRAVPAAPLMRPFDHTLGLYVSLFPLVLGIWLLSCQSLGLYREKTHNSRVKEFTSVTRAVSHSVFAIVIISFFLKWDYSRFFILAYWSIAIVLANGFRTFVRRAQDRLRQKGVQTNFCLIVGTGDPGRKLLKVIQGTGDKGQKIVGVVDDARPGADDVDWKDISWLGPVSRLEEAIRESGADDVYIAKPDWPHREILNLVVRCEKTGAGFKIVSDLASIVTGSAMISSVSGIPVVDLREERHDWGRRMAKRLMDIVLTILILIPALPFMFLLGLFIHLIFPGSVLVQQERVGRYGRLFKMLRFRVVAGKAEQSDFRGSRFGKFLQRTHLDELPQLINVLQGEMSLVGPRPEVPEIVNTYEPWQRKRLEVAPGLTGLWQILGPVDKPLHEDLEYDFYYIKNYSIWMDLSILVQTLPVLLAGKGPASDSHSEA